MLKIENYEVVGWEHAIRGARNPMNSWEKSDSIECSGYCVDCENIFGDEPGNCPCYTNSYMYYAVGPNDHDLLMRLRNAGTDHRKFMRFITVYLDITAPLYWWKEMDQYRVGQTTNSCSTMHKIHDKEFTLEDFSCEHLIDDDGPDSGNCDYWWFTNFSETVVRSLNAAREKYLEAKTKPMKEESKRSEVMKKYWWQMIQLLPSSYNQKRTVMLNYEVLANIYKSRRNHKLLEWHVLCDWIEGLPYSELIVGEKR